MNPPPCVQYIYPESLLETMRHSMIVDKSTSATDWSGNAAFLQGSGMWRHIFDVCEDPTRREGPLLIWMRYILGFDRQASNKILSLWWVLSNLRIPSLWSLRCCKTNHFKPQLNPLSQRWILVRACCSRQPQYALTVSLLNIYSENCVHIDLLGDVKAGGRWSLPVVHNASDLSDNATTYSSNHFHLIGNTAGELPC